MKRQAFRAATLLMLCVSIAGCKDRHHKRDRGDRAEAGGAALVGSWTGSQPVAFSGEGLRTETSDARTTYRTDGGFDYAARLRIVGEKLPTDGLSFGIAGTGEWRRDGRRLTERFTAVTLTPDAPNGPIDKLAKALGDEMAARPASESEIAELTGNALTLRDPVTGDTATYTRAVDEVR